MVATKFRLRSGKPHGKHGKRWAAGHSSDSNPRCRKHRDLVKSSAFAQIADRSTHGSAQGQKLDLDAGGMLDADHMHLPLEEENFPDTSESEKSRLTSFTHCSNATFTKVHRQWKSGSTLHKDIVAVLAAVADTVVAEGGNESDTEYFAAFLSLLSNIQFEDADETQLGLAGATLYLLSLVSSKVPTAVLRSYFPRATEILYGILSHRITADHISITRYALVTFGHAFKALGREAWQQPNVQMLFDFVLRYTIHVAPRVRKAAQKLVVQLLTPALLPAHPAVLQCAAFCVRTIELNGVAGKTVDNTLHVLHLLGFVLHTFPASHMKTSCEALLKLLAVSHSLVSAVALQSLLGLFMYRPPQQSLTPSLNAQVIEALYDFKPSAQDVKATAAWLNVMVEAHVCLSERDLALAGVYFTRFFEHALGLLGAQGHDIALNVTHALQRAVSQGLSEFVKPGISLLREKAIECIDKCLAILSKRLSLQFVNLWSHVLAVLSTFFETLASILCDLASFKPCLRTLGDFMDADATPAKADIAKALSCAIKIVGPRAILLAIPLNVNPDAPTLAVDFPRSWLLPLLRESVDQNADLSLFFEELLPLAVKLRMRVQDLQHARKLLEARVFDTVQLQLWELLPGFCRSAMDLADVMQTGFARALGAALTERLDLRQVILAAIRVLLTREEHAAVMSKYAKNYLPILFNLYTADVAPDCEGLGYDDHTVKLSVLATIKAYLPLVPATLLQQYIQVALGKAMDDGEPLERRRSVMDVIVAAVPYAAHAELKLIMPRMREFIAESAPPALTKKSYRVIEQLCVSQTDTCQRYVTECVTELKECLINSLTHISSAAQASRFKCIAHIASTLDANHAGFFKVLLPDIVLGLKETGVNARKRAALALVSVVRYLSAISGDLNTTLGEAFTTLWPMMEGRGDAAMSALLIAARLLCFEFRNDIASDLLGILVGKVAALLNSNTARTVIQSALEYYGTFAGVFPAVTVGQFVGVFVPKLFELGEDGQQHHFRFMVRRIVMKVAKKLGMEMLKPHVPDTHERLLRNVRKLLARGARHKELGSSKKISDDDGESTSALSAATQPFSVVTRPESIADLLRDTSSESEGEDTNRSVRQRKSQGAKSVSSRRFGNMPPVWLSEESKEQEIVDLLDSKFAQNVSTTDPKKQLLSNATRNVRDHGFKSDESGKLIIAGDTDASLQLEGEDDEDESVDDLLGGRKRRKRARSDAVPAKKEKSGQSIVSERSYKPGGTGIHRALTKERPVKAKGDAKKKGAKFEPYAYVPLDVKALNRRKKAKYQGQFTHLMQGARKGASKARKTK